MSASAAANFALNCVGRMEEDLRIGNAENR